MPHDENNPLLKAFGDLGLAIEFRANAASFPSFTAAFAGPSRIMEWTQLWAIDSGLNKVANDDHINGYGETEDLALAGLKKRFLQTATDDSYLLIKTSQNATGAWYLAVKSDGADGVRNMGFITTQRTETGSRVREIALKR
jgi:hypothetical protein